MSAIGEAAKHVLQRACGKELASALFFTADEIHFDADGRHHIRLRSAIARSKGLRELFRMGREPQAGRTVRRPPKSRELFCSGRMTCSERERDR